MVLFDPHRYAYPSRRSVVYARRAMACILPSPWGPRSAWM